MFIHVYHESRLLINNMEDEKSKKKIRYKILIYKELEIRVQCMTFF